MSTAIVRQNEFSAVEQLVVNGDLAKLTAEQRFEYYSKVCESVGLNPYTRPFDYITLNGKLTLYARKDAADQLRKMNGVSITALERNIVDGVYEVVARAMTKDGRTDEELGAVSVKGLSGEALANAMMKAITKAKRRVTLSICGLGWLDETEIDSIPSAERVVISDTGEIVSTTARVIVEPTTKGTNGNGNGLGTPHGETSEPVIDMPSESFAKHFYALGSELYGKEWDAKRAAIVNGATKGRTASSKDLSAYEMRYLVEKMQERLDAKRAELDAIRLATVPEVNPDPTADAVNGRIVDIRDAVNA